MRPLSMILPQADHPQLELGLGPSTVNSEQLNSNVFIGDLFIYVGSPENTCCLN